jgi:hypothetical protein
VSTVDAKTTVQLNALAMRIRAPLARVTESETQAEKSARRAQEARENVRKWDEIWRETTLELAETLAAARQLHQADRQFHAWLVDNKIELSKDDRAAIIYLDKHLDATKRMIQHSGSWRSLQGMIRYRMGWHPAVSQAAKPRTRIRLMPGAAGNAVNPHAKAWRPPQKLPEKYKPLPAEQKAERLAALCAHVRRFLETNDISLDELLRCLNTGMPS